MGMSGFPSSEHKDHFNPVTRARNRENFPLARDLSITLVLFNKNWSGLTGIAEGASD